MKFLICSDGSKQAENAVRFAGCIAATCHAEVTLLGIVEHPATQDDLLIALRRNQATLQEKHIAVEMITRSGEPVAEILKQTVQATYDMVVIGAVRKATQGDYWLSAKAYKLIKGSDIPVLVVIGKPRELKRIAIATAGASYIQNAVQFAGHIAKCADAEVALVHVMLQPPALYSGMLSRLEDTESLLHSRSVLGQNLLHQKQLLESMGIHTEVHLRHGRVIWELLAELQKGNYDLLTMGFATQSGAFRSYIMGDVTREVINRADRPLLIVHGARRVHWQQGVAGVLARLRELLRRPAPSNSTQQKQNNS
jgi:nucleotide-binding universal stress UspA family protein